MKVNNYLIQLALTIIIILGGTCTIHYFRTGGLLVDQLIGASMGIILLGAAWTWRKLKRKQKHI